MINFLVTNLASWQRWARARFEVKKIWKQIECGVDSARSLV